MEANVKKFIEEEVELDKESGGQLSAIAGLARMGDVI